MNAPAYPPARLDIGLAAAAHLEVALIELERGHLPGAVGSLAAIDADAWAAILDRFPNLPDLITKWSQPR